MSTVTSLRSNFMSALVADSPAGGRRSSAPELALSSPESSSQEESEPFAFEMSDLMLPATAFESEVFGVPQEVDSGATVVSSTSSDHEGCDSRTSSHPNTDHHLRFKAPSSIVAAAPPRSRKHQRKAPSGERRHSLPSTLLLSRSSTGEAVTQPVPEFLCHLHSMLRDPSYSDLISWVVPHRGEPDHMGGGIRGIGKIVVSKPEDLQDHVLGRYYRHSKYASFQRQLNYFGFKKRLHGGKKGKLSPCSYIHEGLTDDAGSLFALKRRPPSKKRVSVDSCDQGSGCGAAVSVSTPEDASSASSKVLKKDRAAVEKKAKKSKKEGKKEKKDRKKSSAGKKEVVFTSMPLQVKAEDFGPPSHQRAAAIITGQFQSQPQAPITPAASMAQPLSQPSSQPPMTQSNNTIKTATTFAQISAMKASSSLLPPEAQPTLLELLSTTLPHSDVLFDDDMESDSMDDEGIPMWVTDDGQHHYHNVDSSLVDLAMIY